MTNDLRVALRLLARDRAYAATAILTLAVCLGANAAVFTIVNSVLLKPLPVPGSDRILVMSFGLVSVLLAAIGIYGVLAYLVSQRSREIGVRMALGSTTKAIVVLVLREGALLVASGVVLGLIGAAFLQRVLASQLYGLSAMDPWVIALSTAVLTVIALVACVLPARRAASVDPTAVLSH